MTETTSSTAFEGVTCPFCALACDDLCVRVDNGTLELIDNGCEVSRRGFQQASDTQYQSPQIDGHPTTLEEAVVCAAAILNAASLPLIAGLATDVNGARAVVALARRAGAVVDHMNGPGLFRNLQIMQASGWVTTSLTEARNRADLMVVAGARLFELYPRLVERVIRPEQCLFTDAAKGRELVLIGPWKASTLPPKVAELRPTIIPMPLPAIGEAVAALRALLAQRPLHVSSVQGVDINSLHNLARRLQEAKYSVITWAAGELDFAHAELTVQSLVELVRDLNATTRAAALPLSSAQGDMTVHQVFLWQTARPLRSSFSRGYPSYDPAMYDYRRVLSQGGADALLWLSSFTPHTPPTETDAPMIVLGHPGIDLVQAPKVLIPVGIPGIDHAGYLFRGDGVAVLPLRQLRKSRLPAAAEVLRSILNAM
jgi:formylmethanofuran dehydrogenase subunit B